MANSYEYLMSTSYPSASQGSLNSCMGIGYSKNIKLLVFLEQKNRAFLTTQLKTFKTNSSFPPVTKFQSTVRVMLQGTIRNDDF